MKKIKIRRRTMVMGQRQKQLVFLFEKRTTGNRLEFPISIQTNTINKNVSVILPSQLSKLINNHILGETICFSSIWKFQKFFLQKFLSSK